MKFNLSLTGIVSIVLIASPSFADDWPQWMGPQRDGVWREKGVADKFPAEGPPVRWRISVNRGYCGLAVAGGRLFMLDRLQGPRGERKPGEPVNPSVSG